MTETNAISFVGVGDFGEAIGEQLRSQIASYNNVSLSEIEDSEVFRSSSCIAAAIGNSGTRLIERLYSMATSVGVPVIVLSLEWDAIRLAHYRAGVPGACPTCQFLRQRMTSRNKSGDQLLDQFFEEHPTDCPAGFLPAFVLLGAQWLLHTCTFSSYGVKLGSVRSFEMETASVQNEVILPVTGCPRCAKRTNRKDDLRHELATLWLPNHIVRAD